MPDLQRREGVHVHVGCSRFHRADDAEIGLARIPRPDAALQANLGGAARPGLARPRRNLLEREVVGLLAVAEAVPPLRKRTEGAAIGADIRVVDVAVDDISDDIAATAPAQCVSCGAYGTEVS